MRKLLADTNFLLMPAEYGIDIAGELERLMDGPFTLQIPSGAIDEVKALAGKAGRRSAAARFFLNNFENYKSRLKMEVLPSAGPVDEWIIKHAQKNKNLVATNDVLLRRRLLAFGVPVLAMKGKSKLSFV